MEDVPDLHRPLLCPVEEADFLRAQHRRRGQSIRTALFPVEAETAVDTLQILSKGRES